MRLRHIMLLATVCIPAETRAHEADPTPFRIRMRSKTLTIEKDGKVLFQFILADKRMGDSFITNAPVTNEQFQLAVSKHAVKAPIVPQGLDKLLRLTEVNRERRSSVEWINGRFPVDRGQEPVLFVAHDEAELFCNWLAKQAPDFSFRLINVLEWRTKGMPINTAFAEKAQANSIARSPAESLGPRPGADATRTNGNAYFAPATCVLLGMANLPDELPKEVLDDLKGRVGYLSDNGSLSDVRPEQERFMLVPLGPSYVIYPATLYVVAAPRVPKQHGKPTKWDDE